jgi:hypothetical protein
MARDFSRAFWIHPLAIEHRTSYVDPSTGRSPKYFRKNEWSLRYDVSLGIIHGAKGIVYFTYAEPGSDPVTGLYTSNTNGSLCPNLGTECYAYSPSILNDTRNPGLQTWATGINNELKALGPLLMNLNFVSIVHGNDVNNYPSYSGWTLTQSTPEQNLLDVTDNLYAPMASVSEINGSVTTPNPLTFAAGVFKSRIDNYEYVIYMNKDVGNQNSASKPTPKQFKISLGGSIYSVDVLSSKANLTWTSQSNPVTVTVNAGDFGILRFKRSRILKLDALGTN